MKSETIRELILAWKESPELTYRSWFLWEERLANFRSVRTGLLKVVQEIELGTFGNAYRGSSLETVVRAIAEQKQIFKGADHAFLWKPKLRIPDIYENDKNKRAFAHFLSSCIECCEGVEITSSIMKLDGAKIKGLGPAASNLLYFLHPTLVTPFNTTIVKGFNRLMNAKIKLGSWDQYLAMREGILRFNHEHRDLLSNDLGAVAGFLFDIGSERLPFCASESQLGSWKEDLTRVREEAIVQASKKSLARIDVPSHIEIQGALRSLGQELGFAVWIASNDQGREYQDGKLGDGCLDSLMLPKECSANINSIKLIDVLWIDRGKDQIVAAFEVEHSTSIYSGILRMLDLALGPLGSALKGIYLVAPNNREEEVLSQLRRPAFDSIRNLQIRYLPYGELLTHKEAMGKFGEGLKAVEAISKRIV